MTKIDGSPAGKVDALAAGFGWNNSSVDSFDSIIKRKPIDLVPRVVS